MPPIPVSDAVPTGKPEWAFLSGAWVRPDELTISADDIGFRQAVIAVERMRTYDGRLFEVDAHLDRWQQTSAALLLGDLPDKETLKSLFAELLQRNSDWVSRQGDVGLTMFATPGVASENRSTLAVHLQSLDHDRIHLHHSLGQPVVITPVVQPPPESWSRQIKVRCRLHYYLADQFAKASDVNAIGLLLDADGSVTETSVCNVAVVREGSILSPVDSQILGGVTQAFIERIAARLAITWEKGVITPEMLSLADEVLLMGTDTGLWFANSINGAMIADGTAGPVCRRLQDAFAAAR
ncbi:aminotransferase class IV [Stieleria varia]|uniref:D-alanine aminotransferase n=1 Tax=Stieleria varia TaxID=2528005 RepID=A0A5C6AT24_9BACT|nr:aminotransferase class IV [Stieleria varia]TWU02577.1 D-alanine aminotransferase [Stieleria varia]